MPKILIADDDPVLTEVLERGFGTVANVLVVSRDLTDLALPVSPQICLGIIAMVRFTPSESLSVYA
jgi:hypothetical protein